MIYLGLSIVAAIILVALAIRRLPYMRTHRLGMEITHHSSPMEKDTPIRDVKQKMSGILHHFQTKRNRSSAYDYVAPETQFRKHFSESKGSVQLDQSTAAPLVTHEVAPSADEMASSSSQGGTFWQDEDVAPGGGLLEIPTKGLITRRGDSQRVAQELIGQADEAFRKKDFIKAEKCYLQAATKDPDNARIYNRLGVIYLQTNNYKDAIEAFRGAIRFDDRVASRHYNLALAYMGKRDTRSAERCLREALRQEPTNEKYRKTLESIQRQPV
jgi:tetratricopeptide (TPR) repeat protein